MIGDVLFRMDGSTLYTTKFYRFQESYFDYESIKDFKFCDNLLIESLSSFTVRS